MKPSLRVESGRELGGHVGRVRRDRRTINADQYALKRHGCLQHEGFDVLAF